MSQSASILIHPDALAWLGGKMYSNHPVIVLCRELVQNAVDATKRRGLDESDAIVNLDVTAIDTENTMVVCDDNGDGMTADQIIGDFLMVGGRTSKNKDFGKEVGGLGLAKLAILWNKDWRIHTQDNLLDKEGLFNGSGISNGDARIGTRIEVMVECEHQYFDIGSILSMLAFNKSAINLTYTSKFGRKFSAVVGGLKDSDLVDPDDEDARGEMWRAMLCAEKTLMEQIVYGVTAFRLKGLTQFVERSYGGRKTNVVIDIDDQGIPPQSKQYPLTTSREGLSLYSMRSQTNSYISKINENALTANHKVEKPNKPTYDLFDGALIGASIDDGYFGSDGKYRHNGSPDFDIKAALSLISMFEVGRKPRRDAADPMVMFQDYSSPYNPERQDYHACVLSAWTKIINVRTDEPCGVGFIGDDWSRAMRRQSDEGITFYLVNPEVAFNQAIYTAHGLFIYLWEHATHELAHHQRHSHNEEFTSEMGNVTIRTADMFEMCLRSCLGDCKKAANIKRENSHE